jgi:primosomal protein N' (replication factor Y)
MMSNAAPPLTTHTTTEAPAFADVVLPRHFFRPFTYKIPHTLVMAVHVGSRVHVPFGRSRLEGLVVAVTSTPRDLPPKTTMESLREIAEVIQGDEGETIPQDLLMLSEAVAERYIAPWGQCLWLITPPAAPQILVSRYQLAEPPMADAATQDHRSTTAHQILERLSTRRRPVTLATLKKGLTGPVESTVKELVRSGTVQRVDIAPKARKQTHPPSSKSPSTDEGSLFSGTSATIDNNVVPQPPPSWWLTYVQALRERRFEWFLLEGHATARTATLCEAIQATRATQRHTLIILPDMADADALAHHLRQSGAGTIALWHSGLPLLERKAVWRQVRRGEVDIVVGTRSAVFLPLSNLGLIYLDQEESPSLKEEKEPRYHALEVARLRAHAAQAILMLSSSHPSVETAFRWRTHQQSLPSCLPAGLSTQASSSPSLSDRPHIDVIDIRGLSFGSWLSPSLLSHLEDTLRVGHRAALILNKKGFACTILCRDCGATPECRRCSVRLTLHKQTAKLRCSYCGTVQAPPEVCPACAGTRLEAIGTGTERLEEDLRRRFPTARLLRMDSDTAQTPHQVDTLRQAWRTGQFDLAVGTHMLLHTPIHEPIHLVALPQADLGLHRPDYRAAEWTYHALMNAAAVARPATEGGRVVLQTHLPTHPVIVAVSQFNPTFFYEQEWAFREALGYPPFAQLINLCVSGLYDKTSQQAATQWVERLHHAVHATTRSARAPNPGVVILGPVPAPLHRFRGRYRWQILVKAQDGTAGRGIIRSTLLQMETDIRLRGVKFEVDVDPVETW